MTEGRNILICGRTGSGKSYLVKRLIHWSDRLVVYGPKREECDYPGVYFDGMQQRIPMHDNYGSWVEPNGFTQFVHWWQMCERGVDSFRLLPPPENAEWSRGDPCRCFRIVYRPADLFDIEEFDKVARLAYACGNLTFVCEELMTYTTERNIGQGFKRLLVAGRTRGVNCFMLTQRPYKIPREVTSQAREAYIFATHEPADLDYCRQMFGTEMMTKLESLQPYEHVHWLDSGEVEVGKA